MLKVFSQARQVTTEMSVSGSHRNRSFVIYIMCDFLFADNHCIGKLP